MSGHSSVYLHDRTTDMPAGTWDETTYESVIAEAKEELNLEQTSDYDAFLERMIDEALRGIDDLQMFESATCSIPIIDGIAQLPSDFIRLFGARFSSNGNCETIPYIERDFINDCGCQAYPVWNRGGYEISGGNIIFHVADQPYDEIHIGYLKRRTDDYGRAKLLLSHAVACKAYAKYRFCQKMAPMQPSISLIREMKNDAQRYQFEFAQKKAFLKGDAQQKRFQEDKKQISRHFNAWITRWNKRLP